MNIAVIGSGISGLATAYLLNRRHRVRLFEAADYAGGHVNTVTVKEPGGGRLAVDTGFIVYNDLNYPKLCRLFDALGVAGRDSDMSFSVRCAGSGLEYNGSNLATLFAQKRNLLKPRFWGMLKDILRFNKDALAALAAPALDERLSIADFVRRQGYGGLFFSHYLQPLGASIWSCPTRRFGAFPARFVLQFLANHRLLQVNDRPQWKTVRGGSCRYVERLTRGFADRIALNTPVRRLRRGPGGVELGFADGARERFDEVVVATHADQALALLDAPEDTERELLSVFPYQSNQAVLHTDTRLLPTRKTAWASWNYYLAADDQAQVTLTYNMNMLQGLESRQTYCVSLNQTDAIACDRIIRRIGYHHPRFGPGLLAAQTRHPELIRRRGVSYCGAYWGYGFHEDGLRSALAVCDAFGETLPA